MMKSPAGGCMSCQDSGFDKMLRHAAYKILKVVPAQTDSENHHGDISLKCISVKELEEGKQTLQKMIGEIEVLKAK